MMTEENLAQLQRDLESFSRILVFGSKSPVGTYQGSRPFRAGAKIDINLARNVVRIKAGRRGFTRKLDEVGRISIEYLDGSGVSWVQDEKGDFVRKIF